MTTLKEKDARDKPAVADAFLDLITNKSDATVDTYRDADARDAATRAADRQAARDAGKK